MAPRSPTPRRPRTHVRRRKRQPLRGSVRWGRRLLPSARTRRRLWRSYRRAAPSVQIATAVAVLVVAWAVVNGIYQALRKPTELFFPVSGVLFKTPAETWDAYASIFRRHSTTAITAEFLAALAQVEASGNPIARTYWRWSWTLHPLEVYRPASSAVGMYQITDARYQDAKRLCIHKHVATDDCWFNFLYMRTVPSHAVEMTAAFLDLAVQRRALKSATLQQKQDLAALIHLCGERARLGTRRCGEHDAQVYLAQVNAMKRLFARLAKEEEL